MVGKVTVRLSEVISRSFFIVYLLENYFRRGNPGLELYLEGLLRINRLHVDSKSQLVLMDLRLSPLGC